VARFELSLRALDPLKLPVQAGSTLRGGFGRAFRRIGCAASALGADQCSLGERCPYHYIFETPVPAGSPILTKVATAPRPFVIEPPLDTRATYEPGERITVGLVLIGRAIDYLPYFIYAFEQLGSAGLGPGRGKFRVDTVTSAPLASPATTIYDGSRQVLATRVASFGLDRLSPAPDGGATSIVLKFLTPTRLVHNAQAGTPAEFHVLFRSVLRRVNFLNHFHCGGNLRNDAGELVEESRGIRTVESRLQWQQWDRYSARQDQRVPMGGCVGDAEYHGDFTAFWPWLALGEWVHVGKGVTFGLGSYQILLEGRH
jgi:hypothetical protein